MLSCRALPTGYTLRQIRRAQIEVLIDSSAAGNFIDGRLPAALGIPVSPIPFAIPLVSLAGQPIKSVRFLKIPLGRSSNILVNGLLVCCMPEDSSEKKNFFGS